MSAASSANVLASPLKVLLFGGTGKIGFNLLKLGLLDSNYASKFHVTAAVRGGTLNGADASKQDKLKELRGLGADIVELDLASASHSQLVSAVKAVDVVVSVTSFGTPLEQTLALVAAAKEAGNLKLFVPSEFGFHYDECVPPYPHGIEEKLKLAQALAASGVPYARIVTGVYYEYFFGPFGGYDLAKRSTQLLGGSDASITLMSERDGAQLTAEVLLNHSAPYVRNQIVLLGGDTRTFGELATLLQQRTGTADPWTTPVKTAAELEQFIANNPTTSGLQRWHLLAARQKGSHWQVQDANKSFVQLHKKANPQFHYQFETAQQYIQRLKL